MNLSPNFAREEFELDGPMPVECIPVYTSLCSSLLEVIRSKFDMPMQITSGYRPPAANEAAHGVSNSQHVATAEYCAADFRFAGGPTDLRPTFDWIREESGLIWDQVILEHSPQTGNDIIHISLTTVTNRRTALEGETAGQSGYKSWPVS